VLRKGNNEGRHLLQQVECGAHPELPARLASRLHAHAAAERCTDPAVTALTERVTKTLRRTDEVTQATMNEMDTWQFSYLLGLPVVGFMTLSLWNDYAATGARLQ
jgi:hypothetical protein